MSRVSRIKKVLAEFVSDMIAFERRLSDIDRENGKRHITHYLPDRVYYECGCYLNRVSGEYVKCELHKLMNILDMTYGYMESIPDFNTRESMSKEYIRVNKGGQNE